MLLVHRTRPENPTDPYDTRNSENLTCGGIENGRQPSRTFRLDERTGTEGMIFSSRSATGSNIEGGAVPYNFKVISDSN